MSTAFLISYFVLWGLVVILSVGLFALYQHFGRMYLNSAEGQGAQGPEIGSAPSSLAALDTRGAPVTIPPRNGVVTFMHVGCRTCKELQSDLRRFARSVPAVDLVAVVEGKPSEVEEFVQPLAGEVRVVADAKGRLVRRFSIGAFPFAIALDGSGIVTRKGMINDRKGLEMLAESISREPSTAVLASAEA